MSFLLRFFQRSRWGGYLLAVGLTGLTLLLRIIIGSRVDSPMLIVFTVPIILSSYWGGLGPGLLATAMAVLGADYFLLVPIYNFKMFDRTDLIQEGVLLFAGGLISAISESFHRTRRRMEWLLNTRQADEANLAQLAAIVQSSDDAIIGKNLDGIVTSWNAGAEKIFGYSAQEMVGQPILRLIPPERHQEEVEILTRVRRGENVRHLDTVRVRKDGSRVDISVTTSAIKDSTGKIIGASKVARDISERRRAEETLRASEARLQTVTDNAHVGLVMVDREHRYTFANATYAEILGLSSVNLVGRRVADVAAPIYEEQIRPRLDRAFAGERMVFEVSFPTAAGPRHFTSKYEPLITAGQVSLVVVVITDITERKQAEGFLLEREEQLRLYAEHSPVAVAMLDRDMKYLVTSHRWSEAYNLGNKSLVGRSHYEVFPEMPPHWREIHRRCLAGAVEKCDEEAFARADGSINWIRWEVRPWRRADGMIGGLIIFSEDITARKQAEESLKLLESAIKQSTESILITDADLDHPGPRIIYVNPAFTQMTGYAAEEVIGRTPRILQGPCTDRSVMQRLRQNLERGEPFAGESVNYRKDGSAFEMDWQIMPLRNARGKITHFVGTQHDVTERKRVENRIRQSEERYRSLVDNARDAIFTIGLDGLFTSLNPAAELISGSPRTNWIGKPFAPMVHPDDLPLAVQMFQRVIEAGQAPVHELRGHPSLPRPATMEMTLSAQRDEAGKIIGVLGIGRDITERKKLETQLRQSQKMEGIGQLAGGVAHDFNNILAVIQMQVGLLRLSEGLSAGQEEITEEIGVTVQRAAALTRQLLLFSRREVFQPRNLDLSASITATAKMLMRLLGDTIRMQLKLTPQPMFIHADAGMLDQVLLNLVVNARDAMPDGGQLVIETTGVEFDEFVAAQSAQMRAGAFVCLSVSDSGCGIPPDHLPKIFEPFFTTKEVGKGTGLGLATVFGIVQQHRGWINVYSEVGRGTTFRIYLPQLTGDEGVKSLQSVHSKTGGGKETILLVEDDVSLRTAVHKALARQGYRILEAPTAVKALEMWNENCGEIRLLLTDMVMPGGMTGKDLAERILQDRPEMKVIYMSGYSAEVVSLDFPLHEGVNFLTKPFQAGKLIQIVRDRLDADR